MQLPPGWLVLRRQRLPSVASDSSGNVIVVWHSPTQDGSSLGVFGQRYDNAGASLGSNFRVNSYTTNAQISPSLGRSLAACGTRSPCTATVTIPLVAPNTLFESRSTQLDLRLTKLLRLGSRMRLQANVDVYNALNANTVLAVNNTYSAAADRKSVV